MEEQGVGGFINLAGESEPALQVLQHCSCAHVGGVEATED